MRATSCASRSATRDPASPRRSSSVVSRLSSHPTLATGLAPAPPSPPPAPTGPALLGDLTVNRMALGAMRVCGPDIWGPPKDRAAAHRLLRRAVELGVNFFDHADSYGPGGAAMPMRA